MADIKNIQKEKQVLDEVRKTLEKVTRSVENYGEVSDKTFKGNLSEVMDLNKALKKGVSEIKEMSKEVRDLHIEGALGLGEANKLNNELLDIEKKLGDIHKKKTKELGTWEKQKKLVADLNKRLKNNKQQINLAKNTAKSFVTHMEEAGPSFMKGWAKFNKASEKGQTTIQNYEGLFNKAGIELESMPGLMKKFGAAAKGVSSMLGGITEVIAGWPGAVFMAVKALWDVGMQADQFVKDANKAFAYLRGPDIMTKDIKKQFKDFNDQIYQASENIRVGMDVTQIRELMEAMVQAGANIQNLNKGLLSYRDAIYIAGKASKTLGLVLPQVGNMIGKMLTDFRMDMESIDKAFVQVAFDAKKSGLSTDRFWATVENSSASLALYGVIIGSASKTMKRFTEDMVGGADDAAEATEDMYGVFKSGNLKAQATLLSMAKNAGVKIDDIFENMSLEFKDQAVKLQSEIQLLEAKGTKTPEDVDQLKRLRSELASAQSKSQRALDVMNKDAVIQTTEMGMLAKEAPRLLIETIRRMTGVGDLTKVSLGRMHVAIKSLENVGVKEKTVRMLVEQAKVTKISIANLLGSSQKFFSENNKSFQENKKDISTAIMKASKPGEDQAANSLKLVELLKKSLGMDEGMAGTWAEIIKTDKIYAEKLAQRIGKGDAENLKGINELLQTSDFLNKYQIARFKTQEKTDKELAKASEDSFDELVKGTLSYKEMVEIAKNEIEWRASNLQVLTVMNKGVADIYRWLTKDEIGYLTESEKVAQEQLKATLIGNQEMGKLLETDKEGNVTRQSQLAMIKETAKNINELNELVSIEEGIQSALDTAMKTATLGGDPITALSKSMGDAQQTNNKELAQAIALQINKLQRRAKTEPDKTLHGLMQDLSKENTAALEINKAQKTAQEAMQTNLMEMNRKNEQIYKIQKLKLMGDKASLMNIADQIYSSAGDDQKETKRMAEELGLDLKDVKKAYEAKGIPTKTVEKMMVKKERTKAWKKGLSNAIMQDIPMGGGGLQGLQEPVRVTSPRSAVLHPEETILPRSYSKLKTIPVMNEPVRGGAPVGGAGGESKQISINVTATEKDLAQKIANEVRAVLNKEYMGV